MQEEDGENDNLAFSISGTQSTLEMLNQQFARKRQKPTVGWNCLSGKMEARLEEMGSSGSQTTEGGH